MNFLIDCSIVGIPLVAFVFAYFLDKIITRFHNYRPKYIFENFEARDELDRKILAKMQADAKIGFRYHHIKPVTFTKLDEENKKYHAARQAFLAASTNPDISTFKKRF